MRDGDAATEAPLFESPHELVAFKPPGVSCELPGAADELAWRATLERARGERLRLCHRLDRIARGLVLIARTAEAAAFHAERMRARRIAKVYLVRVDGVAERSLLGTHRAYLRRRGRRTEPVRSGGDPAMLEVLEAAAAPDHAGQSHIVVRLGTGRFHQIRAMLASLGHPLAGDVLYGGSEVVDETAPWLESAVLRFLPFGRSDEVATRSRPRCATAPEIEAVLAHIESTDISPRGAIGDDTGPPSTQ